MQDFIPTLLELQQADLEIQKHKKTLKLEPEHMAHTKDAMEQARQALEGEKNKFKALQVEKNDFETDIAQKNTQIDKHKTQLLTLKSNKEYKAKNLEIDMLTKLISEIEDKILINMEASEVQSAEVEKAQQVFNQAQAEVKDKEQEFDKKLESTRAELEAAKLRRKEISQKIAPKILKTYERIFANKKGICVVELKNDVCHGCNMLVPKQTESTLRKTNDVVLCDNCSRMLYWAGETTE